MERTQTFKTLLAVAIVALLVAPTAMAGEYHMGTALVCAECHTMHFSQSHDYGTGTTSGVPAPTPGTGISQAALGTGPNEYLLRQAGNALCLSCHDSQTFAGDVLGNNTGTAFIRQGGGLNSTDTSTQGYAAYMGHTLGSSDIPPGWDQGEYTEPGGPWANPYEDPTAVSLDCVDCHEPHGAVGGALDLSAVAVDSQYRNLRANPGAGTLLGVTYNNDALNLPEALNAVPATNVTGKDVFLRDWDKTDLPGTNGVAALDFNEPVASNSAIGRWCNGCHVDFHGSSTDSNMKQVGGEWVRHPTADVNIGPSSHSSLARYFDVASKVNYVKVMDPDGYWEGENGNSDDSTGLTPTCISCHKSHGNKNPFGLIYMGATGTASEEGTTTGTAQDLCQQCHIQGT